MIVVAISFGLQVWNQHNATLGRFMKTSFMPLADCFLLLALGAIPLLLLEFVKVVRNKRPALRLTREKMTAPEKQESSASSFETWRGMFRVWYCFPKVG